MKDSESRLVDAQATTLSAALAAFALLACLPNISGAKGAEELRYTVAPGDTLIAIANELLREPRAWPALQKLNQVADPRRLRPGSSLRIPIAMLRPEPATARVTAVRGDVRADGKPLRVDGTIARGMRLTTGEQGFASIELVDGSRLVLQPSSRLRVEELSRLRLSGQPESRLRLEAGRIESVVTKSSAPRPRYTVVTPTAAIGVRGTQFRVGTDEAGGASRTEVTDGTVSVFADQGKGKPATVTAGYGVVAETGGKLSAPVALLPAPNLRDLPALQERTIVRLSMPPIGGASAYRFQLGTDTAMRNVVAESSGPEPAAKFADLPDGHYTLRARGIDARGLEGRDADFTFKLKARPEAPFAVSPVAGSTLRGESAELTWTSNAEAARYRVQLASDGKFAQLVADIDGVEGTVIMPARKLAPGEYHWRARSIRADGDLGPWGDVQRFVLKPLPADPEPPLVGEEQIAFAWSGEPRQAFLFQFARDAEFADLVAQQRLDQPRTTLPRPAGGTYFLRVQATDEDGFVGPFTRPQTVDVPTHSSPWWLLLMLLLPAVM